MKFTKRGEVRLCIARAEAGSRFEVTPSGIGIEAQGLPTLFEAFRQADAPTARTPDAAGFSP